MVVTQLKTTLEHWIQPPNFVGSWCYTQRRTVKEQFILHDTAYDWCNCCHTMFGVLLTIL